MEPSYVAFSRAVSADFAVNIKEGKRRIDKKQDNKISTL